MVTMSLQFEAAEDMRAVFQQMESEGQVETLEIPKTLKEDLTAMFQSGIFQFL